MKDSLMEKMKESTKPTFLSNTQQLLPLPIFVTKTSLRKLLDGRSLDTLQPKLPQNRSLC